MANYTDLTTLEGLQVGDVITYTTNNTAINLAGKRVKLEVIGNQSVAQTSAPTQYYGPGGYACGIIKSDKTIYFIAGSASNTNTATFAKSPTTITDYLYTRFLVAGNGGQNAIRYTRTNTGTTMKPSYKYTLVGYVDGGAGGGLVAEGGNAAGTQSSGGIDEYYSPSSTTYDGGFGKAGGGRSGGSSGSTYYYAGAGGFGWYGGSYIKGAIGTNTTYAGAGGSGYALNNDSFKPDGYMSDWSDYVLSDVELVTGGAATYYDATTLPYNGARITILEDEVESTSTIQYYAENEFIPCEAYYYSETGFIQCEAYYYNGTEFKILGS